MKSPISTDVCLAVALFNLLALLCTQTAEAQKPEWRKLFNGKDLSGWKANAHPDSFTVVDGTIKAYGKHGMSHLFFVGDSPSFHIFKDFELEAVVRGEPRANSGIFFHTDYELRKRKYLNKGYEVQLNSTDKEKRKTGSLYAIVDLATSPVDETQWFTIRVRVQGKKITVYINNAEVLDYNEPENPKRPKGREKRLIAPDGGGIALQAHDPDSIFYFKSIRIREL